MSAGKSVRVLGLSPRCNWRPSFPVSILLSRRYSSQRSTAPYMLSRLVIELDAADSPYVKPVEELNTSQGSQMKRSQTSRKVSANLKANKPAHMEKNLPTYHVTPLDLLSYSILGDRAHSSQHSRLTFLANIRQILHQNQIKPGQPPSSVLDQLLHGSPLDATTIGRSNLSSPQISSQELTKSLIKIRKRKNPKLDEIQHLVSIYSPTRSGCDLLNQNSEHLEATFASFVPTDKSQFIRSRCAAILTLLNNLFLNMESKGITMSPHLCTYALEMASNCMSTSATNIYLRVLEKQEN